MKTFSRNNRTSNFDRKPREISLNFFHHHRLSCVNKFLSSEVWALQHRLDLRNVGLKTLEGEETFLRPRLDVSIVDSPLPIASRSFLPIARCTNLRSLQLDLTSRIKWDDIASLNSLQSLIIDSVPPESTFSALTNLTQLHIGLSTHADSQIRPLTSLRKLAIRGIQHCGSLPFRDHQKFT
jgi:hypothetical protein